MTAHDVFVLLMFVGMTTGAYFLPFIVALSRGHRNTLAIFFLNAFLGWTLLGWVVAIVWAAMATQREPIAGR